MFNPFNTKGHFVGDYEKSFKAAQIFFSAHK